MTQQNPSQTLRFDAEVKQLLHLFASSIYSNRDIFLRELIANANDAIEKRRYKRVSDPDFQAKDEDAPLKIWVDFDKERGTLTVRDAGIGMSREELINNLGTIASSGTRAYLEQLSKTSKQHDLNVIGQFGVGFYSVFVVADQVTVTTRAAGSAPETALCWTSAGEGEYTIHATEPCDVGTTIVLHLKEDAKEYLDEFRLRKIIDKYSNHIPVEIIMYEQVDAETSDGESDEKVSEAQSKESSERKEVVVNQAKALWTLPKSDISDEQYQAFYKYVAHAFDEALSWAHNRVEGSINYTSLLYIPSEQPFDLMHREARRGLKLYMQRVFIMEDADQFLPLYLRFVKGVIDCKDLPLNVSREILQNNHIVKKIKSACTKRVLDLLEKMSDENPEKYSRAWKAFGQVLKEGPGEDFANKDRLAKLFRFASTHKDQETQEVSLADYVSRMKPGQEAIYYLTADGFSAAKNSPHLEVFRDKGIEVLLLYQRVDEWLVAHLNEFEGKPLQSVTKGNIDLKKVLGEEQKAGSSESEQSSGSEETSLPDSVIQQMKSVLKDKVKDIRSTERLTASPACLVTEENEMSGNLQRLLKEAGQSVADIKPVLELNPNHPLVARLKDEHSDQLFAEWSHLLFDQALLAEGGQLQDPAGFVKRLNALMLKGVLQTQEPG